MTRFAMIAAALALATPAAAAEAAGNAQNGQRLYMANLCYTCHGTTGAGGGGAGPTLAPTRHTVESFTRILRRPIQRMPPFTEKVLSDAQAADIHAYLRSVPAPRPASEIPLLRR